MVILPLYIPKEAKKHVYNILSYKANIVTLHTKNKNIFHIIIHNIIAKKALLMILDGWGIGKHGKGDVIYNTPTPYLDYLTAVSAHSQLLTCGEDVGLPDGQMGNSEVGHLNIGAGRIVY